MKSAVKSGSIPGTILSRERMNNVSGAEFLEKVFYVTDGIMLSQIREITGIDGTTLQNWVKRGWVANPTKKAYTKDQLARILLINMMRDTIQLSQIIDLFEYINGTDEDARVFSQPELYDCVCKVLDAVSDGASGGLSGIDEIILDLLRAYDDIETGAKVRVLNGIRVIVVTYYATTMKATAEYMLSTILDAHRSSDGNNTAE